MKSVEPFSIFEIYNSILLSKILTLKYIRICQMNWSKEQSLTRIYLSINVLRERLSLEKEWKKKYRRTEKYVPISIPKLVFLKKATHLKANRFTMYTNV